MWNNYIADIEKSGKKVKDVIKDEKKTRKEYDNIAQRRVRLGLFFNKIAEDESITVSDDEVNKALFEQARNYPGQESEIIKLYQENPGAMMQIRSPLVEEKVVDYILTLVKIKEYDIMPKVSDILKEIKDTDIKFVDLRFTDPRGKLQHVTMDASVMDSDAFAEGIMFDGSSIAGWKAINESDMTLMPDPDTAHTDPFFAQSTMGIFCDILDPISGDGYERDPRSVAKKAEAYLKSTGIGDTSSFGPEAEFFMFDDVRFAAVKVIFKPETR